MSTSQSIEEGVELGFVGEGCGGACGAGRESARKSAAASGGGIAEWKAVKSGCEKVAAWEGSREASSWKLRRRRRCSSAEKLSSPASGSE